MQKAIKFRNGSWEVAAHMHLPQNFEDTKKYAAIICLHPGSSVKEQTAGLYASKLAEGGFVALVFDTSYQGESGGEPRFKESPETRVEDVRCAVDFLTTCSYVDRHRIGIFGVCAGGGYAANAALTEKRIKAVGTVVATNAARAFGELDPMQVLEKVGEQRTSEANGGTPLITPWTPDTREEAEKAGVRDMDMLEAIDYYRTARGGHPGSCNKLLFTSMADMIVFDTFHLADKLLTQPLLVVVGDKVGGFGSYRDGFTLYNKAASEQKKIYVVEGASHYDLYDQPKATDAALSQLLLFFRTYLS